MPYLWLSRCRNTLRVLFETVAMLRYLLLLESSFLCTTGNFSQTRSHIELKTQTLSLHHQAVPMSRLVVGWSSPVPSHRGSLSTRTGLVLYCTKSTKLSVKWEPGTYWNSVKVYSLFCPVGLVVLSFWLTSYCLKMGSTSSSSAV